MADESRPAITAARIAAAITSAPSTAIGAALAAIRALTPAADKAIYFTSSSAAALMDMPATARTFLASFPTPAFAAAVSMASNKITGLAMGDTAGNALRFEALGTGALPTLTGITVKLGTGRTNVENTATDGGVSFTATSADATARLCGVTWAGTRIAGRLHDHNCMSSAGAIGSSGWGLWAERADGKIATFSSNGASLFAYYWTSINAFSTSRATIGTNSTEIANLPYLRLGQATPGGNILFEVSTDGVTYTTMYSATPTAVFGDAGDITAVGFGAFCANATAWMGGTLRRAVITP